MLPANLDQTISLGKLANDLQRPVGDLIADLSTFAADGKSIFDARRTSLGRVVDTEPHGKGVDLLGPVLTPPPLPIDENLAPGEVRFADANAAPGLAAYGSTWTPSVQRLASLSVLSVRRTLKAMAQNVFDSLEESVSDSLNALSLGSSQTATSVAEAFSEFAALETSEGGYAPSVGGVLADESLRPRAADENWAGWGIPLHFLRLGTSGRFFLVPQPETGAVCFGIAPGLAYDCKVRPDAVVGWLIRCGAFAWEAPVIRSEYIVKGTLS